MSHDETIAAGQPDPHTLPSHGALILQGGPRHGARQALTPPLLLVGRDLGCDLRLDADGIEPLHCALHVTSDAVILRDLKTRNGTHVNDQRTKECLLRDGDRLRVGGFEFQVEWLGAASGAMPAAVATETELEALRIQAAAVAAQQAQLTEQESRLEQKRQGIETQQRQLADHLEERRRKLVAMQDQLHQERAHLEKDQAAEEQKVGQAWTEIRQAQAEAKELCRQGNQERRRIGQLRTKLQHRWKRYWKGKEHAAQQREKAIDHRADAVQKEDKQLEHRKLSFLSESALKQREIDAAWTEMAQARQEWDRRFKNEQDALSEQKVNHRKQVEAFHKAQRIWASQCQQAEVSKVYLEEEARGLEARIQNLRSALDEQQAASNNSTIVVRPGEAKVDAGEDEQGLVLSSHERPLAESDRQACELLGPLAEHLDEQRLHLVEQWEKFLQLQELWRQEHPIVLATFEQMAKDLDERETAITRDEEEIERKQNELVERQQANVQLRMQAEAQLTELRRREAEWKHERDLILAETESREALLDKDRNEIAQLHERWRKNRHVEVEQLRKELKQFRRLQSRYSDAWEQFQHRISELGAKEQSLAERALALEQLRVELVTGSESAVAADKRVKKLERSWSVLHAQRKTELDGAFKELSTEMKAFQSLAASVHSRSDLVIKKESELIQEQTDWEHQTLREQQATHRRVNENESLRRELAELQRHAGHLRHELEDLLNRFLKVSRDDPPALKAA